MSVLRLAGKQSSFQTLGGMWGVPGSVHDGGALDNQERYLRIMERVGDKAQRTRRCAVWLGDINMVLRLRDASKPLARGVRRLQSSLGSLSWVSAFIHHHDGLPQDDGAYTFHRLGESRSLIDHVFGNEEHLGDCGICTSASAISDHFPVVCEVKAKVSAPELTEQLTLPQQIFGVHSGYDVEEMREWASDDLDGLVEDLGVGLEEALQGRDGVD